jgi:hypothetical protein
MACSLSADGIACYRGYDAPIEDMFIFGERSTGTNVTKSVLRKAFGLPVNKSYGWKHGSPSFLAASARTLFVVSLRNAFDWSISMYAKPYHATAELKTQDFDHFIKSPWVSVMDTPRSHGLKWHLHHKQPFQPDRHPITGRTYRTIFEMREIKTKSWMGLVERGVNVAIIRHETFSADLRRSVDQLAQSFDLRIRAEVSEPEYIFRARPQVDARRKHAKARLPENIHYIRSQLDTDFEHEIGYEISDLSTN